MSDHGACINAFAFQQGFCNICLVKYGMLPGARLVGIAIPQHVKCNQAMSFGQFRPHQVKIVTGRGKAVNQQQHRLVGCCRVLHENGVAFPVEKLSAVFPHRQFHSHTPKVLSQYHHVVAMYQLRFVQITKDGLYRAGRLFGDFFDLGRCIVYQTTRDFLAFGA